MMVVCTTKRFAIRSNLPNCVPFQAGEFGMPSNCVAQCEAIYALEKGEIDNRVWSDRAARYRAVEGRYQGHRRHHRLGLRTERSLNSELQGHRTGIPRRPYGVIDESYVWCPRNSVSPVTACCNDNFNTPQVRLRHLNELVAREGTRDQRNANRPLILSLKGLAQCRRTLCGLNGVLPHFFISSRILSIVPIVRVIPSLTLVSAELLFTHGPGPSGETATKADKR